MRLGVVPKYGRLTSLCSEQSLWMEGVDGSMAVDRLVSAMGEKRSPTNHGFGWKIDISVLEEFVDI